MSSYQALDTTDPTSTAPASTEDCNWALAAHVGSFASAWFALGLFAPLVVLLARGDSSPFVRRHAVESLNFQLNALVWTVVFGLLAIFLVGIPLLVAYGVLYLVCVLVGTVRAGSGRDYRYPLTVRIVH